MAGNSVIGALRVDLGLDTAQFEAGLKEAQGTAAKFGTALGIGLAAATTAAVSLGVALAEGARQAIDHADALSKAAQKAGVTTEALSRLEYAAKLSDVSLEGLTGGLEKLSKSMADSLITPTSTAAIAFKALGISVTDAAGHLRPATDVLNEIADRFARLSDGATKTTLAMQLFGKSGAELIPLLNGGSAALRELADESDRTGNTVSTKAGKAAEELNDTITRLQLSWSGLTMQLATASIPALQNAADTFTNLAAAVESVDIQGLVNKLAAGQNQFEKFAAGVGNSDIFKFLTDATGGGANKNGLTPINQNDLVSTSFAALGAQRPNPALSMRAWWQGAAQQPGPTSGLNIDFGKVAGDLKAANSNFDVFNKMLADVGPLIDGANDPFRGLQSNLDKLGALLNAGKISWAEYGEGVKNANLLAASSVLGSVGQLTGALSQLFEGNKAFAVANAVVNTAEGVTKALASAPPPLNFLSAAAVAASGAAQIAAILSAQPGSGSVPSVGGGGGIAAAPAPAAAPVQPSGPSVTVQLVGGSRYSRDEVLGLIKDINSALGDGAKLNVA